MPKVPLLSPEIRPQATPMVSPAPMLRPPEGAFGAGVAEAQGRQGQAIQNTGDVVWQRMFEHQERANAQQLLDIQTNFQKDVQNTLINPEMDDNNMPKGYLNRSMNQAKGATAAFDQDAIQLKQRYIAQATSPIQKQDLNRILSTHLLAARESVIGHEAQQTQAAFDSSFQNNMKQTVGNAATVSDPAMLSKYIDAAQLSAEPGWKHAGLAGVSVDQAKQGYAAQIIKSAITPVLEADPKQAQALLDGVKGRLSPEVAAEIQQKITGKKIYDIVEDVTAKSKSQFRMADGMIDRTRIDSYVDSLHLQPEISYQVKSHVDHLAMVDYSEQMKKRQDSERSFTNELVTAQSKGVPYDQALKIPSKYGWDATSTANMDAEVTKLYANPLDRFNTWISRQPQATQGAWSEAENIVKAKYGNITGTVGGVKQKMSDAAITELKQDVIGKNADQIREIAKQKLDKVVIGPGAIWGSIWPDKAEGWRADADTRKAFSDANAMLERDYGAERLSQARAYLATSNVPITPKNLKAALDRALKGNQ